MKKFIQSFLAVFTIVFTIGMGYSLIGNEVDHSYHGESKYEHTYGEGLMADKIIDRAEYENSEQDANIFEEQHYLASESDRK